jgi:hypothetical protein
MRTQRRVCFGSETDIEDAGWNAPGRSAAPKCARRQCRDAEPSPNDEARDKAEPMPEAEPEADELSPRPRRPTRQ